MVKEAFRGLRLTGRMVFLSTTTMSLSILIFGIFLVTTLNTRRIVRHLQEKVEIEVFLNDSISTEQSNYLLRKIPQLEGVMEALYISKEAALHEAQLDSIFLDAVGTNPLPASIRIRLKEGYRSAEGITTVVHALEAEYGIEEIASGNQWTLQLDRFVVILFFSTVIVGTIFGLASALVISNTVQLTIFSRSETIGIMKLVGAKDSFISGPFVLEGILQGVIGAVLAVAGLSILHWAAQQELPHLLPLGFHLFLIFIVLGGILGGLGSGLAVNRFLKAHVRY